MLTRFCRSQLTELQSTNTDTWAKESFEIATKFYQNGGLTGSPRYGNNDCTTVAAAPKTAVAVELDLVEPFLALRQLVDQSRIHRLNERVRARVRLCWRWRQAEGLR
jgi:hypothetical protein